jgi:hypothetical protein
MASLFFSDVVVRAKFPRVRQTFRLCRKPSVLVRQVFRALCGKVSEPTGSPATQRLW